MFTREQAHGYSCCPLSHNPARPCLSVPAPGVPASSAGTVLVTSGVPLMTHGRASVAPARLHFHSVARDAPGSFRLFLPSPGLPQDPWPLPWRTALETKIWVPGAQGVHAGPPALLHPHVGPSHPSSDTPGPPTRLHGPVSVKTRAVSLQPQKQRHRPKNRLPRRRPSRPVSQPQGCQLSHCCLPSFRKVARPQSACHPGSLLTSQVTLFAYSKAQCLCRKVLWFGQAQCQVAARRVSLP